MSVIAYTRVRRYHQCEMECCTDGWTGWAHWRGQEWRLCAFHLRWVKRVGDMDVAAMQDELARVQRRGI